MEAEACSCVWRQRMFFAAIAEGTRGVFRVFVVRMTLASILPVIGRILEAIKCLYKKRPVTHSTAPIGEHISDHGVTSS